MEEAKKMRPREYIKIRGANEHNLKNINVDIPRNELVVLTGMSGSGKSSLAFDTIYAEGQRRYMESLSSYARQFLGQMEKPNVESIEGLSPAISIDQKSTNRNPRSTVGTVTEIYDYFRLLYARIGIPHCPKCGREIAKQTVDQMVDQIMNMGEGTKIQLLAPVVRGRKGEHAKVLERAKRSGYVRVRIDGSMYELTEEIKLDKNIKHNIDIVVDRLVVKDGIQRRLTDSIENVLELAEGLLVVDVIHPTIHWLITLIPHTLGLVLLAVFSAAMVVDLAATVRTIARINRQLTQLDELAGRIKSLSNELGESLAERVLDAAEKGGELRDNLEDVKDALEQRRDEFQDGLEDMKDALAQRRDELQDGLEDVKDALAQRRMQRQMDQFQRQEQRQQDLEELRRRLEEALDRPIFGQRRLMRAFPRMRSTTHTQALERLRQWMEEHGR